MDEFRLLRPLSGKTIKEITGSLKSPACQPAACDETDNILCSKHELQRHLESLF